MSNQILKANWVHPKEVESWLYKMKIGYTLNVCCGMSRVGNVRLDITPHTERTEEGDLFALDYPPLSFDTVICDPPFSYYNKFKWIYKLAEIPRKRLILSSPNRAVALSSRIWTKDLYWANNPRWLRTYWVFDRKNNILEVNRS